MLAPPRIFRDLTRVPLHPSVECGMVNRDTSLGHDLIVISHHLSSIRLCDSYIRINGGRIVASGSTADFHDSTLENVLNTAVAS